MEDEAELRACALSITEPVMERRKIRLLVQFHPSSLPLPLPLPFLFLLVLQMLLLLGSSSPAVAQDPTSLAINCGSSQSFIDITSNRTWQTDLLSNTQIGIPASSQNQSAIIKNAKEDEQVYRSARIFTTAANYSMNCVAGTSYFLRLFFNAFSNSNTSHSLLTGIFSVAIGDVKLLSNWNISGEVDGREDAAHMREYGTTCPASSSVMVLHLLPAAGSFAFINGFELFPMPDRVYPNLTTGGYTFFTYYRWNCGGSAIPSDDDELRRRWSPDLPPPQSTEKPSPTIVKYSNVPPTFTPAAVFKTSRQAAAPLAYNLVVERGAWYFVRLLFAELDFSSSFQRLMVIQINGEIRLPKLDVYYSAGWSTGMWLDFFPIQQTWERRNISIMLQKEASSKSDMMSINGLEVLKIGKEDLSITESVRVTEDGGLGNVGNPNDARILQAFISAAPENGVVLSNWTGGGGDVCAWTGVECEGSEGVVGLDLSAFSPRLEGGIPEELGDLKSLRRLVLSNQSFEGPIPASLGKLRELEILLVNDNLLTGGIPVELASSGKLLELAVQNNNLSGEVPGGVLRTVSKFTWRGGNGGLCAPAGESHSFSLLTCGMEAGRSSSGKPSTGTVVGIVVGSVVGCAAILALAFVFCLKRDSKGGHYLLDSFTSSFYSSKSGGDGRDKSGGGFFSGWSWGAMAGGDKGTSATTTLMDGTKVGQRFSFDEIVKATCQFDDARIIGMGGFGNVYRGELADGEVVAVKRGTAQSGQGAREFQTEIVTLSKLRHRHLVSLIGYCDEDGEMILVYEYMAKGTLRGHLYGKGVDSGTTPLSWRKRLEICIESARGLEYLHSGAQDMVIHRDVKSTNILLDDNLAAKVADFGLSKSGPTGINETHVSTAVKGSFGYLDPAYFKTTQLTEKSDVYSFGVVLLEIITARSPIMQGGNVPKGQQINLADWAVPKLKAGKVEQIVDPKLVNSYGTASLHKVAEVALRCLDENRDSRPSMADVLRGLEDAMVLQDNSLSVVLDNPGAMMSTSFYNVNDSGVQDFTSASGASYPPSPPESVLMAR